jgi:hypothetical protein
MMTTRAISILCVGLLIARHPYAFLQQPPPAGASQGDSQKMLSPGQLESLVAPIALYPDPILSQVLVASTYPLEIVEAGRWLSQNSNLKDKALADAVAKQPWDASVQALVVLPDVLTRLDQNVGWTSDLGNAFLAQQNDVMDAIQRMRQRASAAGALQSTPQQTVTTTTANNQPVIVIEPASPQVVYIPQYNPVAVWGPPPPYYPFPPIYYPPVSGGAIVAASAISFGAGLAVGAIWGGGWGGWGWNAGWGRGGNAVVINNNFINNNRFNRVNVANGNRWVHNPAHRGGVPYNNRNVANRFQGAGAGRGAVARPTVGQTQQRLNQNGMANRSGMPGTGNANRLGPGNAGRGAIGQPGNRPGGRGAGTPGQGNANRLGPGNAGRGAIGQPGQARPAQPGIANMPSRGGANRMGTPGNQINRGMPGGGNRGGFGGMNRGGFGGGGGHRGGGGFGGGGGRRGGGGGRRR